MVSGLCAPASMESCKPRKITGCFNPPRRTTVVSAIFKFADLSACCDNMIAKELIRKLRLSGCAVVSKGILVIEGDISSIKSYTKLITDHGFDSRGVKILWQGEVCRPSFGKFSILRHCGNDFPLCKFFADHGASHYWEFVVKSNWD